MQIFKKVDVYDRHTGKKEVSYAKDCRVCDITGFKLDDFDNYHPRFSLDYEDADACFGEGPMERELRKLLKKNSNFFAFMSQPYDFLRNVETGETVNWYRVFTEDWNPEANPPIDEVLRTLRCTTAIKLIKDGLDPELLMPHLYLEF